jgi:hypothetical protein
MAEPSTHPKRPRPWDPDAIKTGAGFLFFTLVTSLVVHSVIPFAGMLWPKSSVSLMPRTVEFFPLPPAEEFVDSPDEETTAPSDAPPAPDVPPTPVDDTIPPSSKPPKKPVDKPPQKDPPPEEEEVDEPDEPDQPPPPSDVNAPKPTDAEGQAALAKAQADAQAKREQWLAERQKRREARAARRAARAAAAEAARKGGAPEGGEKGVPREVHLCGADDKGPVVNVRSEKAIGRWVTIIPSVFAYFPARPGMGDFLDDVDLITTDGKRLGNYDFSLPAEVLQLELEEPAGARVAIGRLDARCQVGIKLKRGYFPLVLRRVPVRLIDKRNKTLAALINITIYKDFRIELESYDKRVSLPFTEARLKNQKQIERNIQEHMQAAQMVNAVTDFLGLRGKK